MVYKSDISLKSFLRSGEFERLQVILDFVALGRYTLWRDCSPKEFNFLGAELAFGHCKPESYCADALEDLSQIVLQLFGSVCGNPNVIHVLGAFVRLMALSRYSLMKLEKDDSERLSPWASLRYANVLLAKLKARSWPSAVRGKLVSNQAYKTISCQRGVAQHRLVC